MCDEALSSEGQDLVSYFEILNGNLFALPCNRTYRVGVNAVIQTPVVSLVAPSAPRASLTNTAAVRLAAADSRELRRTRTVESQEAKKCQY